MRKILLLVSLIVFSAVATLGAEDLTLPAAASIVGGAPFFSDVRAFNTSYTDALDVTAHYRCFIPRPARRAIGTGPVHAGAAGVAGLQRHRRDHVPAPNTRRRHRVRALGQRRAARRDEPALLDRAPAHGRHVHPRPAQLGGVPDDGADLHPQRAAPNAGFRTNVGVFNREDSASTSRSRIFDGGRAGRQRGDDRRGGRTRAPRSTGSFSAAGQADHATENAVIVVSASHEIFSYAAVIDNNTTDPIFVVGAEDEPFQETTPTGPTPTPTAPARDRDADGSGPTVTPTPPVGGTRTVNVGQGGTNFVDQVSGNSTSTITVGTTVNWVWVGGFHNVESGACPPCDPRTGTVQLRRPGNRRHLLAHLRPRRGLSRTTAKCTIQA